MTGFCGGSNDSVCLEPRSEFCEFHVEAHLASQLYVTCEAPEENLRPNVSNSVEARGKPMDEIPQTGAMFFIESIGQYSFTERYSNILKRV
jgi:hypothetical protein